MIFKFLFHVILLFFFFDFNCSVIRPDVDRRIRMHRFSVDIKNILRFFYDSPDTEAHGAGIDICKELTQQNFCTNSVFSAMKNEFIKRARTDEKTFMDRYFTWLYTKKHTFYVETLACALQDHEVGNDTIDIILSMKFDAIMCTIFAMTKQRDNTEQFGVFNEFFDIIKENNFIIDETIEKILLNKIIEVMKREQSNFFILHKQDRFELIFIRYGLSKENDLLWRKLLFGSCLIEHSVRRGLK